MKIFVFWLKFDWSLLLRIQLTITQYWFRLWLPPNWQQAIIWTNADPVHWHIYAALGGNELIDKHGHIHYLLQVIFDPDPMTPNGWLYNYCVDLIVATRYGSLSRYCGSSEVYVNLHILDLSGTHRNVRVSWQDNATVRAKFNTPGPSLKSWLSINKHSNILVSACKDRFQWPQIYEMIFYSTLVICVCVCHNFWSYFHLYRF